MKISDIHRAIDVATSRFRKPTLDQIVAVARELFPDEMTEAEQRDMRRGTLSRFKDAARQVANIAENDVYAPMVTLELFPGLPMPGYLNIDNSLIKGANANDFDMEVAVAQRESKAAQIVRRAEDLARKRGFRAAHQTSRDETNAQIIERLKKTAHQQRSVDDQEGDQQTI